MARRELKLQTPGEVLAEAPAETVSPEATEAQLPPADSIDAAAIPYGGKILTAQGWVVSSQPDPIARRR